MQKYIVIPNEFHFGCFSSFNMTRYSNYLPQYCTICTFDEHTLCEFR